MPSPKRVVDGAVRGIVELKQRRHVALLFAAPGWQRRGVGARLMKVALAHTEAGEVTVGACQRPECRRQSPADRLHRSGRKGCQLPEGGLIAGYVVGEPVQVRYSAEAPAGNAVIEDRGAL